MIDNMISEGIIFSIITCYCYQLTSDYLYINVSSI